MKKIAAILFLCLITFPILFAQSTDKGKKIPHVLLITGGHDYDEERFEQMLEKLAVTYDHVRHPNAYEMLKADKIALYDVVLLYDMPKEISEEAQKDFITMLEDGMGLVVLHHAFCSYDFWPEYIAITGGRYHHFPWKENDVEKPVSTYKHDVTFDVKVVDRNHPITRGVENFRITDETYGGTEILPTVHPLLATDESTSGALVCWTNHYRNARVATFTLGHDHLTWKNPAFIRILSQSIRWAASF